MQKPDGKSDCNVAFVGKRTAVGLAIRQVFQKSRITFHSIDFDGEVSLAALDYFDKEIKNHHPLFLLAETSAAWEALRVLNVWPIQCSVFANSGGNSALHRSKVIPLPGIPEPHDASLFDHFAARRGGVGGWIVEFLQAIHDCSTPSDLDPKTVRLAILNYQAARERHGLCLRNTSEPHGPNDIIASLRILQGAKLDAWITSDDFHDSCEGVFAIAKESTLLSDSPGWRKSQFAQLSPELVPTGVEDFDSFGTLMVGDDEGFWRNPLKPIWRRLGFEMVPEITVAGMGQAISGRKEAGNPVRIILLDMRLKKDDLGGAKLLQALRQNARQIPIVALSVDDQFSETVLLKRMGVFAYLNKHALAEPSRGRDALSAFRQVKDAVLIAAFASLADDFWQLWCCIAEALRGLMEEAPESCKNELSRFRRAQNMFPELEDQIRISLDAFSEECRRMFHGFWQDSAFCSGLACRQMIRALGLINDKWCSLWKVWRFDPDMDERSWSYGTSIEFPYLTYHKITTAIRGEASHAMLKDEDFDWLDVWITFLTLFLKIEGTSRAFLVTYDKTRIETNHDRRIGVISRTLRHLLKICGSIEQVSVEELGLRERLATSVEHLDARLKAYLRFPFTDAGFIEGDNKRLTVQTYLDGKRSYCPVTDGLAHRCRTATNCSDEQLRALGLVLDMMAARVPSRHQGQRR